MPVPWKSLQDAAALKKACHERKQRSSSFFNARPEDGLESWAWRPEQMAELAPEHCAISLEQLRGVAVLAQRMCKVGLLLRQGSTRSAQWSEINMHDMVAAIVKPVTRAATKRGERQSCSWVELLARESQPPKVFVSHNWGGHFRDFMVSIEILAQEHGFRGRDHFWICTFALDQWFPDVGGLLMNSPFLKALRSAKHSVLMLDRAASSLTRIWCLIEIYLILDFDLDFEILTAMGPVGSARVTTSPVVDALLQADVRNCQATDPADRRQILNYIAKQPETEGLVCNDGVLQVPKTLDSADPGYEARLFQDHAACFHNLNAKIRHCVGDGSPPSPRNGNPRRALTTGAPPAALLPRRQEGRRIPDPVYRGMTLAQLRSMKMRLQQEVRRWPAKDSPSSFLDWDTATFYDFERECIGKPMFFLDRSFLDASEATNVAGKYCAGLPFFRAKRIDGELGDRWPLPWGSSVSGTEEDGWVKVGDYYLPMSLEGVQVLTSKERELSYMEEHEEVNEACKGYPEYLISVAYATTMQDLFAAIEWHAEARALPDTTVYWAWFFVYTLKELKDCFQVKKVSPTECVLSVLDGVALIVSDKKSLPFKRVNPIKEIYGVLSRGQFVDLCCTTGVKATKHPFCNKCYEFGRFDTDLAREIIRFDVREVGSEEEQKQLREVIVGNEGNGEAAIDAFNCMIRQLACGPLLREEAAVGVENMSELIEASMVLLSSPTLLGVQGQTPLMVAAAHSNVRGMEVLLKAKADPNAEDIHGETPLHYAALASKPEAVKLLIVNSALPDKRSHYEETALDVAEQNALSFLPRGPEDVGASEVRRILRMLQFWTEELHSGGGSRAATRGRSDVESWAAARGDSGAAKPAAESGQAGVNENLEQVSTPKAAA